MLAITEIEVHLDVSPIKVIITRNDYLAHSYHPRHTWLVRLMRLVAKDVNNINNPAMRPHMRFFTWGWRAEW